jgi:hypothetical protein
VIYRANCFPLELLPGDLIACVVAGALYSGGVLALDAGVLVLVKVCYRAVQVHCTLECLCHPCVCWFRFRPISVVFSFIFVRFRITFYSASRPIPNCPANTPFTSLVTYKEKRVA